MTAGCATRTGSPGAAARVRELSHGRIGYLHVPDMVSEGWADFHRDLHAEIIREALIVDVRGNRGGHTSQLVVEKLARRVIGWDIPRGLQPTTYPDDAPRGPVVALTDEHAGSDGDIVTAAIKILGLGPVVGHAHLGWRDRHRRAPARARRGHRDERAAVLHLVRQFRLGGGEPGRRPGRRGGGPARGLRGRRGPAARDRGPDGHSRPSSHGPRPRRRTPPPARPAAAPRFRPARSSAWGGTEARGDASKRQVFPEPGAVP